MALCGLMGDSCLPVFGGYVPGFRTHCLNVSRCLKPDVGFTEMVRASKDWGELRVVGINYTSFTLLLL